MVTVSVYVPRCVQNGLEKLELKINIPYLNIRYNRTGICNKKSKDILVTGLGYPWGCEMLRFPHFLDSRLIDGGKVVSLTPRPHFTPQKNSWYSFLLEAESTPGP
jgi:hypothetical protein